MKSPSLQSLPFIHIFLNRDFYFYVKAYVKECLSNYYQLQEITFGELVPINRDSVPHFVRNDKICLVEGKKWRFAD
jgi:hypothetical protein